VEKTTVYLPEELKRALKDSARREGVSEATLIREAIRQRVSPERPRPRGALFRGESLARRVDELLEGFGER